MPVIKSAEYSVTIGNQAFKAISTFLAKHPYSTCFILCDENTLQHCLPLLVTACPQLGGAHIIEIESGETSKSLEFCAHIWQTFLENKADKNTLLINLGGGVVSDLGGFTASVYKRGIDFIHIPTSLLAMADASVGGKTGIDFNGIKNVIGSFALPKAVFVYPGFLSTLPARHYRNGLAEVFKIALIYNKPFWTELLSKKKSIGYVLMKSIALKNEIVMRDPFDKGQRKILNFGHTVGHALEALFLGSAQELLHGEAVVAGMLIESHLAFQKKLIAKQVLQEISLGLQTHFDPKALPAFPSPQLMQLMENDKKTAGSKLKFALIGKIGQCHYDVTVSKVQLQRALSYYQRLTA